MIKDKSEDKINAVEDIMKERDFEDLTVYEIRGKTRGFIKIQEVATNSVLIVLFLMLGDQ